MYLRRQRDRDEHQEKGNERTTLMYKKCTF